jgi:DNA-directed RNA polymerase subunit RPC12/RpoP
MGDAALMEKYDFSEDVLKQVLGRLVAMKAIEQSELDSRDVLFRQVEQSQGEGKSNQQPESSPGSAPATPVHESPLPVKFRVCPKCGKEYPDGSKDFCPQDGFKLIKKNPENTCAKCGAELDENSDYCGKCGAKVFLDWDYSNEDHYYQVKFHEFERNHGDFKATWNWAAFFFGGFWYFAKGMWGKALLMFGTWIFFCLIGLPFLGAPWALYCPIVGNYDYYLLKKKKTQWW